MISEAQYENLVQQGYTHVPLVRELPADLDTPVALYLKLAKQPHSYLLESANEGRYWGRYSIIGTSCRQYLYVHDRELNVYQDGQAVLQKTVSDPLAWIEEYLTTFRIANISALPRFCGGLVGYFGYEAVRYIEPKLTAHTPADNLHTPDIFLLVSTQIAVLDNLRGTLSLIVYADTAKDNAYQEALQTLQQFEKQLHAPIPSAQPATNKVPARKDFISSFERAAYLEAVEKCRRYISDGEAMQIVLSQRMQAPFACAAFNLYRALRRLNPSPYMFYFDFGDFKIAGSSPEILVRQEGKRLTVRPIAGTRHRGETDEEDLRLEKELLSDAKELAEHLMLIDLGRNDLGRVAVAGSVRVTEQMIIERYSHVMHIVSNVVGEARSDANAIEVLRATFPAGTVSGAPKVRAMEIISELEPIKRNIYAGAVGYIGWNSIMDTAIAIRTAVIKDETLYVQTGAGLVYDSRPENEWNETLSKANVLFAAAKMAGDFV